MKHEILKPNLICCSFGKIIWGFSQDQFLLLPLLNACTAEIRVVEPNNFSVNIFYIPSIKILTPLWIFSVQILYQFIFVLLKIILFKYFLYSWFWYWITFPISPSSCRGLLYSFGRVFENGPKLIKLCLIFPNITLFGCLLFGYK